MATQDVAMSTEPDNQSSQKYIIAFFCIQSLDISAYIACFWFRKRILFAVNALAFFCSWNLDTM